jgi:5'-methylthioadenosine/S-adenosylhomocysteine nucleosidase
MILVVASSQQELQGIQEYEPWHGSIECLSTDGLKCTPGGKPIVAVAVGVGKVQAALNTAHAIHAYKPSLVVGIGTCGAIRDDLCIGDILVASSVIQYDIDLRRFGLQRGELPSPTGSVFGVLETDLFSPTKIVGWERLFFKQLIGCADRFLVTKERKELSYIIDELHVDAVDMESFAMVAAARQALVPVAIVRTVSDTSRGARARNFAAFLAESSIRTMQVVMDLLDD